METAFAWLGCCGFVAVWVWLVLITWDAYKERQWSRTNAAQWALQDAGRREAGRLLKMANDRAEAADALVAAISAEYADVRRQSATSEARIAGALETLKSIGPYTCDGLAALMRQAIAQLEGRDDG